MGRLWRWALRHWHSTCVTHTKVNTTTSSISYWHHRAKWPTRCLDKRQKLSSDRRYLVMNTKEFRIVKEVKRSNGSWHFMCGNVFLHFNQLDRHLAIGLSLLHDGSNTLQCISWFLHCWFASSWNNFALAASASINIFPLWEQVHLAGVTSYWPL